MDFQLTIYQLIVRLAGRPVGRNGGCGKSSARGSFQVYWSGANLMAKRMVEMQWNERKKERDSSR